MTDNRAEQIIREYENKYPKDVTIYPNIGRTMENFITSEKSDVMIKAINFTVDWLARHKDDQS